MKKIVIVLLIASALLSCSNREILKIYTWKQYIAPEVIKKFEKSFNVNIKCSYYTSNEQMIGEIARNKKYDILIPSDYAIQKLISMNILEPIDYSIVNTHETFQKRFYNLDYDKGNVFSVPYMWGSLGIVYNSKYIKNPEKSWKELWNPAYQGKILMYNSVRDAISAALILNGKDINTKSIEDLKEAKELLFKQKPLLFGYSETFLVNTIASEKAWIGMAYSGDAVFAYKKNNNINYFIPDEGSNMWTDALVILKSSEKKLLANKFINFLLKPENAALNTTYSGYSSPVKASWNILSSDIKSSPGILSPYSNISNCSIYKDLGDFSQEYDKAWREVKTK